MSSLVRIVIRGAALSSAGMLVSMAGTLLGAILFTHALSSADVGIFALLILFTDLAVMVNNFGLVASLPRLTASSSGKGQAVTIHSTLWGQAACSLILAVPLLLFWLMLGEPSRLSENASWLGLFPLLCVLPPLFLVANFRDNAMAVLAGINRYGWRAIVLGGATFVNVVLILVFVRWLHGGLGVLIAVTFVSYVAAAAGFYAGLPALRKGNVRWEAYRDTLVFSWPLYLNSLLGFAFLRLDTVFVAALLGTAQAAYFEYAAKKLPTYVSRLMVAALTPYLPGTSGLLAEGKREEASLFLNRASSVFIFFGYVCVLVALLVQEQVIGLLFPRKYLQGAPALSLIMISTCLVFQGGIMGQTLIALGRPGLVTCVNVVSALVSVGANFLLIPKFGIAGAGCAAVLGAACSDAGQAWMVRRCGMGLNIREFVQNHVFLVLVLLPAWWWGHVAIRLLALFAFVALCLGGRTVMLTDAKAAVAALMPHRNEPI